VIPARHTLRSTGPWLDDGEVCVFGELLKKIAVVYGGRGGDGAGEGGYESLLPKRMEGRATDTPPPAGKRWPTGDRGGVLHAAS